MPMLAAARPDRGIAVGAAGGPLRASGAQDNSAAAAE
jgi:hypothetical protein